MKKIIYLFAFMFLFSSCALLNQSIMFKTEPTYKFAQTPDYKKVTEYKISPNDILVFEIFTNSGYNLINITSFNTGTNTTMQVPTKTEYLVDADGNAKLPILGDKHVAGFTIREVEAMLEQSYSEFYNKPFVVAKVTNRKVIYFTGNTSEAKTIALTDNNTTLLQLIANQGGMSIYGKAKHVKLIRDINGSHEVYHINLATINGINDAHIVLQANDIIYIEPRRRVSSKALGEIAPILSLLSSSLLIIAVVNNLKK